MSHSGTLAAVMIAAICTATPGGAQAQAATGVTVHEWGTFTTVAGADGRAVDWLPLSGPADLPCFVYRFQNNPLIKLAPGLIPPPRPLTYDEARTNLWGKVRMETPVLYFYAPQETAVSVRVQFPRGLMTEWYPQANVTQGNATSETLRDRAHVSVLEWPRVIIKPAAKPAFLSNGTDSHYYAARATDAAPIVANNEMEKFLFYRGVADFDVPITAEVVGGTSIRIRNTGPSPLPGVIVFENRNGALGYRVLGTLHREATVAAPERDASTEKIRAELVQLLVKSGLYQKEATAMVDTWGDSWFEEGTRVFYIVPTAAVDAILPLTVSPAPASVARVFVGRMDVITPAMLRAVEESINSDDDEMLDRFGRLLGPITDRILAGSTDRAQQMAIRDLRNATFARYTNAVTRCQ